jgi:hypothetical protein
MPMLPEPPATLVLDEAQARRLLLAQAVEAGDPHGKLMSLVERDALETAALAASREAGGGALPEPRRYLLERAQRILAHLENRNPRLAALQDQSAWQPALAFGLPFVALLMGAGLDRIGNPKQVNMLSPPLLLFLLWNVVIYLGLLAAPLLALARAGRGRPLDALQQSLANGSLPGRAKGGLHAGVAAQFRLRWWRVAGRMESWRLQKVLHSSAAAWAIGVALSIAVGGLVREYRVGWESTLLELPQVHAILRTVFAPVVALLPLEPFSLADLQRMHFGAGVEVARDEARRWVVLYIALLMIVVVVPRALLAAYAGWRQRRAARAIRVDLRDPYFVEVMARVSPARVRVALLAPHAASGDVVRRVLREASPFPEHAPGLPWVVLETPRGDVLQVVDAVPASRTDLVVTTQPAQRPWWARWPGAEEGDSATEEGHGAAEPAALGDVVLLAVRTEADLQAAAAQLRGQAQPVVVLADADAEGIALLRGAAERLGLRGELLALAECAACWPLEPPLRSALLAAVPAHLRAGMERLLQAWHDRHHARWQAAAQAMARTLAQAARDAEDVKAAPLSLRRILSAGEREASQQAREEAKGAVLGRLDGGLADCEQALRELHGLPSAASSALGDDAGRDGFLLRDTVDAPQAGMAGAASGAAAGATVDLLTGGLTLGAAAALGALLGGTGALTAAIWKNRATAAGQAQVQLSDEMMQTLTELLVLRYLALIHEGRRAADTAPPPAWKSEAIAAVAADGEDYVAQWQQVRQAQERDEGERAVARLLQATVRRTLTRLYGARVDL